MEEELDTQKKPVTEIETQPKVGLGVKILLTTVIFGSVAAGIYLAITLAK